MKLLYPHINTQVRNGLIILTISTVSLPAFSQVIGQGVGSKELSFRNAVLDSGVAGADNAIYRFTKVETKIDALVRIVKRSDSKVKLLSIDVVNAGWDKAFQPQVTYNNNTTPAGISNWYMEFEIKFVETGTKIATEVAKFDCSGIDIDGNGQYISENVTFFGIDSYTLEANSMLNIVPVPDPETGALTGKLFQGPRVNFVSIDTSGTTVMTTVSYKDKTKFRMRAGGNSIGASGAADRLYAFWFRSFNYNSAEINILPIKMNAFNAKLNSNKVMLDWEVSEQQNISHYIVERSLDGAKYKEAGLVFANSDGLNKYNYTDLVSMKSKSMVYYRLKAVSFVGTHIYSLTKMIRMDEEKIMKVLSYPNPVTTELRVSIPQTWQDQTVSYDLYNLNGQLIKNVSINRAGQTEVLNMQGVQKGMYTVKVSCKAGTAIQKIMKAQ